MKILIGIIVACAIVGGGVYVFTQKNTETPVVTENKQDQSADADAHDPTATHESQEVSGSLDTIIALGKDYKCTFTHNIDMGNTEGTVYISGKNIRGNFLTHVSVPGMAAMTVENHMIRNGDDVYSWSSLSQQGFKGKVSVNDEANSDQPRSDVLEIQNTQLDYNCESYSPDSSLFTVPTSITFVTSE